MGGWEPERLVEAAVLRAIGVVVPQVPFAEEPGAVARPGEEVGGGRQIRAEQGAPARHVDRPVAGGVETAQKLPPGGRAHGGDMKVGKPQRPGVQRVEVGRAEHRVPVAGKVAVSLIVSDDDDDVGRGAARRRT